MEFKTPTTKEYRFVTKKNIFLFSVAIIFISLFISFFIVQKWYKDGLMPLREDTNQSVRFTIEEGESTQTIVQNLAAKRVIKNADALHWYLRLEKPEVKFQAGRYALSPTESAPALVKHLESGKTDLFMVTFVPGSTLKDIRKSLKEYGYTDKEITIALEADYDSLVLADKPAEADLEGYIYPETFEVQSNTDLQSLLKRDFDTLHRELQVNGLIKKFKARGLTIHQALTMASIIQKEVKGPEDQKKVAQVLYKRLAMNMKLEVDPTFIYAAEKLNKKPRVDIDSPYNTRLYEGLPPGPIGNMNLSALKAVADPATTDYLYFVAGDDGTNYFSKTLPEHEANAAKYCIELCNIY